SGRGPRDDLHAVLHDPQQGDGARAHGGARARDRPRRRGAGGDCARRRCRLHGATRGRVTARRDTESETMTARRILVVDDEPGMRAGLAEVLARGGFDVDVAGAAEEALERLRTRTVDLLVTDLRLPGLSGLELLR